MTRSQILALPNAVPIDPLKIKDEPEFKILIWPPEAIERNESDTFCFTDIISRMIRPNASDCVQGDDFGKQRDFQSKDFQEFLSSGQWGALLSMQEIAKIIGDDVLRDAYPGVTHWSQDWREQTDFDSILNLEYLELTTVVREGASDADRANITGISGSLCGFAIRPIKIRRNSLFLEDQPNPSPASPAYGRGAPTGNPHFKPMVWKFKSPQTSPYTLIPGTMLAILKGWETLLPYGEQATGIGFTAPRLGVSAVAETAEKFLANQGFEVHLAWLAAVGTGKEMPGYRFAWGSETYSIIFRNGSKPAIEKLGADETGAKTWWTWRTIDSAPVVNFADVSQANVRLRVRRIAGRMCVDLQMGTHVSRVVVMDARSTKDTTGPQNQKWELQEVKWPTGKFKVSAYGLSFSMNVSLLQYEVKPERDFAVLSAAQTSAARAKGFAVPEPSGAQLAGVGTFSRFVFHPFSFPSDATGVTWRKQSAGYKPTKTCVCMPDPKFVELGGPVGIYYAVGLRACNKGTDSPFVSSVTMACGAIWEDVDYTPIDVASCFIAGSESGAEPGVTTSADWNIELSPDLLDLDFWELPAYHEYGRELPGWKRYIRRRNPITFSVRWRYKDGSYGPWVERFDGYIHGVSETAGAAGMRTLSFSARDHLQRMVKPASMCDHRFVPLDLILAEKEGEPLFSVEAIYEIILAAVGMRFANRLNGGNGIDKPSLAILKRFLPPGFPALLSGSTDAGGFLPLEWNTGGGAPTQSGPVFPVPWSQDAMSWAVSFATREFCLLFTAFTGRSNAGAWAFDGTRPVPVYGHYYTLMRDRPVWILPDAVRLPGDESFTLRQLEAGDVPEWQINEVLVWSMMEGAGTLPFPATIQGGASLDGDDPESAQRSYRRTLILQEPKMFFAGAAEGLAMQIMGMFANKQIRRVRMTFAGEEQMGWGDKVAPILGEQSSNDPDSTEAQYSPTSTGVGGELFRVVRLNNSYRDVAGGPDGFQTTVACAPYNARYEGG